MKKEGEIKSVQSIGIGDVFSEEVQFYSKTISRDSVVSQTDNDPIEECI